MESLSNQDFSQRKCIHNTAYFQDYKVIFMEEDRKSFNSLHSICRSGILKKLSNYRTTLTSSFARVAIHDFYTLEDWEE